MSSYTVHTTVPVTVVIHVDDNDPKISYVTKVVIEDEMIPSTIESVRNQGGLVKDENDLTVKPWYFNERGFDEHQTKDGDPVVDEVDWLGIVSAYDNGDWGIGWEFGW